MSKAVMGAVEIAGAVALGAVAIGTGGLGTAALAAYLNTTQGFSLMVGLAATGISTEAGAIASALSSGRSVNITDRRPASNRQIVYGTQMVGGVLVYESVTGHQYNSVIAIASHSIHSILGVYLDGRKIYFKGSGSGWSVRNGIGFGGDADSGDHLGPDGVTKYNFGGKVYCEARYGDQTFGDYMGSLNGNDPAWGPKGSDCPSGVGVAYIYLKCTASSQFPQRPEIRILVNGKDDVYDPRTTARGFSNNSALVLADMISNATFGLGDSSINTAQLIAAANIADESVAVAALSGATESRYCTDMTFDTGTSVSDAMETMRANMNARLSYIGGEWWIMPGAYVAPVLSFGKEDLTGPVQWNPARSVRDLPNRVLGTHVSAEYPYSVFGGYYLNRSGVQNNFDLKFQQTSVPYYALDALHGYPSDQFLSEDLGHVRPLSMDFQAALSVTQCQRLMKQALLAQRAKQGSGTLEMGLSAYRLQPGDTFKMTFPELGWDDEILEVTGTSLRLERSSSGSSEGEQDDTLSIRYSVTVRQTDPSIYAWSTIEELNVYAAPAAPTQTPWTPNPPTSLQLSSGAQTAIVGQDGSVIPVIQVTWDTPLDNAATGILVQYRLSGTSTWYAALTQDISVNVSLISNVVAGRNYDVRIATVRANGATSDWVEQDNFPVPTLNTFLGTIGPLVYTGISNNLVPNGDFILGNLDGWLVNGAFYSGGNGGMLLPGSSYAFSPTFAVQPGNKYRIRITGAVAVDGTRVIYHRIFWGSTYVPNVNDTPVAGYQGLQDFLAAGDMNNQFTTYTYDWTCPQDTHYATIALYQQGTAQPVFSHVVVQDYSASAQWGADVTAAQPISHSGTSESIVPNGNFVLGTDAGWVKAQSDAQQVWIMEQSPDGPRIHFTAGTNDGACSPTFAVVPGQKYRINFRLYTTGGSQATYLRLASQALYAPNITSDNASFDGSTGKTLVGFMESGSVGPPNQWVDL